MKAIRNIALISALMALIGALTLMLPASARVTEADKQKVEEQISKNEDALADIVNKLDDLKNQSAAAVEIKQKLDEEAAILQDNIELTQGLIETYRQSIKDTILEISRRQRSADEQYEQIKRYLRTSYETGSGNLLQILFSSSSLSEMMTRAERLRSLVSYQESRIEQLEEERSHLATLRARYESDLAQTEALEQALLAHKQELARSQAEAADIISRLNRDTEEAKQMQAAYEKAEKEFEDRLNHIIEELEKQAAAGLADGPYVWPCLETRNRLSSYFGDRPDPFTGKPSYHNGIDIPSASGEPIFASNNGVVVEAGNHLTYGFYILLSHGDGITTLYAHNSELEVVVGQVVKKGEVIAKAGSTGKSTGPHCHFEMRIGGKRVDPLETTNPHGVFVEIPKN